jgi:hypothetical protein
LATTTILNSTDAAEEEPLERVVIGIGAGKPATIGSTGGCAMEGVSTRVDIRAVSGTQRECSVAPADMQNVGEPAAGASIEWPSEGTLPVAAGALKEGSVAPEDMPSVGEVVATSTQTP